MKHNAKNILFYSLTSLAALSLFNVAHANGAVTVPVLEGGVIASVGTFYALGSADNQDYATSVTTPPPAAGGNKNIPDGLSPTNNDGEYDFGFEASLGYIFPKTANGLELSFKNLNSSSEASTSGQLTLSQLPIFQPNSMDAVNHLDYEYNDLDLMLTQYLNLGHRLQTRLAAGAAYLGLEQEKRTTYSFVENNSQTHVIQKNNSSYNGVGPRLGLAGRYDLGNGFGFLGGVSAAFFMGSLNVKTTFAAETTKIHGQVVEEKDDRDNQDVLNLNGNLAVDYVYTLKNQERSSLGLELGYRMDYYDNAVGNLSEILVVDQDLSKDILVAGYTTQFYSAAFSGPYLDIKAAF